MLKRNWGRWGRGRRRRGVTRPTGLNRLRVATDLPALEDLSGLAGLTNLGDTLRVDSADRLTTLDSLAALTSVNILLIRVRARGSSL